MNKEFSSNQNKLYIEKNVEFLFTDCQDNFFLSMVKTNMLLIFFHSLKYQFDILKCAMACQYFVQICTFSADRAACFPCYSDSVCLYIITNVQTTFSHENNASIFSVLLIKFSTLPRSFC